MNKLLNYFQESWTELKKVSWPTPRQAVKLTLAVALFSVVFSGLIGIVDYFLTLIIQKIFLKG